MTVVIWLDHSDAHYRILASNEESAGAVLREKLVRIGEIGKWSPVTVELVAVADNGQNVYREVR